MKTILLCLPFCLLIHTKIAAQYCSAGPSSTADSNVESVSLSGNSGTSISYTGCPGVAGVQNSTAQSVTLATNLSYTANVQFGTCGGNYSGVGEAWIDWNQNQIFEAGESIGTWSGTPPTTLSVFGFTVPTNAVGGPTRMRVMQQESGSLPLNPCGTFTWGSVVDFTVVVLAGEIPSVAAEEIIGLQPNYCNSSVAVDFVVRNKTTNQEYDVPWFATSDGVIIAAGSIAVLDSNSLDTISINLVGVGPAGLNASFSVYTNHPYDQTRSDDTLTASLGMSYLGVNASLSSPLGCSGAANGSITAMGHSGVGSYSYQWGSNANNQTSNMATGLMANTYMITVVDGVGCSANATLTLMDAPPFSLTSAGTDLSCYNDNTGSAMVTPNGGVANYTYSWSNGAMGNPLSNLAAGTYTVTVSDASGCVTTTSVTINEPTEIVGTIMDNGNGTATANATGGAGSYTYQWDPAAGNQTTATATGLSNGTYYVVITDANGCTDVVTVQTVAVGLEQISTITNLSLYPNPSNSNVFVKLNLIDQQEVQVSINTLTGQTILSRNLGQLLSNTIELETSNLAAGVYLVQFTVGTEQITKKLIKY